MQKKRVLFIVNPASGPGDNSTEKFTAQVAAYVDSNIIDYQITITQNEQHASELSRIAVEQKTDIVVAVGGDGTINEVASGLIGSDTALGIIPAGSGNGLAHHLKIPFNVPKAISLINKGRLLQIDTISVNDKPFLSIAGIGFDALVADKFAGNTTRGLMTYLKIVLSEYLSYQPHEYEVSIDGNTNVYKALMMIFANSDQFGYNTSIAPEASIDDGLMDVCIVKKIPLYSIPFVFLLLVIHKIHWTSFVHIIKAHDVVVHTSDELIVNIDGEPVTMNGPLKISLIPHSLKVVIP